MMLERFIYVLIGVFVTLLALVMCTNAEAATIRGNAEACEVVADVSETYATWRDNGMPWETAKPKVEASVAEALSLSDISIIKDKDDAEYALKTIKAVWHQYASSPPRETAMLIYVDCMKP